MMKTLLLPLGAAILLITAVCDRNNPYDPESDDYKQVRAVKSLPGGRTAYGFAALDTTLYLVGGSDGGTHSDEVRGYVPSTGEWDSSIISLPAVRCSCLSVTHNGRLYVFGGKVTGLPSASVLSCAPGDSAWKPEQAMPQTVYEAAAVSLGAYVYVIGGRLRDGTILKRCDRFNPADGSWDTMAPMSVARIQHATTVSGGLVYVGGGKNDVDPALESVEMYNPSTDTWSYAENLRGGHDSFILAATNGYLFALDSGDGYQNTFEERDSTGGTWRTRDLTEPDDFTTGSPAAVINNKIFFTDGNNIYQFLP